MLHDRKQPPNTTPFGDASRLAARLRYAPLGEGQDPESEQTTGMFNPALRDLR